MDLKSSYGEIYSPHAALLGLDQVLELAVEIAFPWEPTPVCRITEQVPPLIEAVFVLAVSNLILI
jgi:hypothetical protein